MIWVIFASILWSSVSGLSEYHRIKDRQLYKENNNDYIYHSEQWHKLEFFDTGLAIGTGVAITLDAVNEESLLVGIADLFVASAVRWNLRDGVYNMKQGNDFYYQSPNTTSSIEQLGTPLIKIGYLIATIIFRLLL